MLIFRFLIKKYVYYIIAGINEPFMTIKWILKFFNKTVYILI
jgi:hypothetical protein